MLVEVCANSLESAISAQKAGADRIELCSELSVGGVTPSFGLLEMVKKQLTIPVHLLIRPRSGHFTYSDMEFEVMKADIEKCRELGVDGIVSGILKADFTLDVERTKALVELGEGLHFTFHRAFDWVMNPELALRQLEEIGASTVLTSGTFESAASGIQNLKKWQDQTEMTIMAGGGVSSKNASMFKEAGLRALHLSGTHFVNSLDLRNNISMNSSKHWVENKVPQTDEALVHQVVQIVK
ncbi:copper homeostasis protein CutC [Flagellimonas nanhaiensis]|uniref:PF03932 family protein CutC n=1 Tax=Flagellimonas nanhaiensis TaxID=2292706 RepID=A0A371JNA5_9FLAO|nr:copper homeostasis protein CutC [Allomuricauda nanhaiensis]RDY58714.1 copper homeostasis protein CutC [Allomuricauda nanhaiensis]